MAELSLAAGGPLIGFAPKPVYLTSHFQSVCSRHQSGKGHRGETGLPETELLQHHAYFSQLGIPS